jgi:hypothetical protein
MQKLTASDGAINNLFGSNTLNQRKHDSGTAPQAPVGSNHFEGAVYVFGK